MGNLAYIVLVLWLRMFALSSCQRVREHSSCQTWRVECVKTTPLLSLLTIPSSQRQKLVSLSFSLSHWLTLSRMYSLSLTHSLSHMTIMYPMLWTCVEDCASPSLLCSCLTTYLWRCVNLWGLLLFTTRLCHWSRTAACPVESSGKN